MTTQLINKKVRLTLIGLNGNAWVLLGVFSGAAKRQGWTEDEIKLVCDEAMSDDYNHLLRTLDAHCEEGDDDEDE